MGAIEREEESVQMRQCVTREGRRLGGIRESGKKHCNNPVNSHETLYITIDIFKSEKSHGIAQ